MCYLLYKTNWPGESISRTWSLSISDSQLNEKKKSSHNVSLMRKKRRAGGSSLECWIWTHWVTHNSLSAANRATEFSPSICGNVVLYEYGKTDQILISSVLFHVAWILLQEFCFPLKPPFTATLIFDESCNSWSRIYWENGLCANDGRRVGGRASPYVTKWRWRWLSLKWSEM